MKYLSNTVLAPGNTTMNNTDTGHPHRADRCKGDFSSWNLEPLKTE